MARGVGVVECFLHGTGFGSCQEAAFVLHGEEQFPSLLGQRAGELLHEVGASGHVHDLVEVALFLQQELLVAGDALGEVGRRLVGRVERRHHDGIHVGQCGAHRFRLAAEHVHVAVEDGHVVRRGRGVDLHLAGAVAELVRARVLAVLTRAYRAVLLDDVGPEHACGAELGDFHEIDATDAEVELDFLGGQCGGNAGFHHLCEVFVAPCQCVAQFLIGVGAGVAERVGVHAYAAELGERCQRLHQFGQLSQERGGVLSFGEHLLHRVEVDAADQRFRVVAFAVEVVRQQPGQLHGVSLARLEVQFHRVGLDAFEQGGDEFSA